MRRELDGLDGKAVAEQRSERRLVWCVLVGVALLVIAAGIAIEWYRNHLDL